MTFIEDPGADRRSRMLNAPSICSGEKTGHPCAHYWALIQKFRAANADTLRDGEKQRACTLMPGWPLEFTTEELPTKCNKYTPSKKAGLLALVQRAIGLSAGYEPVYSDFELFNPMLPAEIEKLRADNPDRPEDTRAGKNPLEFTADDIINGPQIGILKPGESLPGQSPEVDDLVNGLFGNGEGLFKKKD